MQIRNRDVSVGRVSEFLSEKLSRSFFVPRRKSSRRQASFAEHTTRFDSLAPSASSRFCARIYGTLRIHIYKFMEGRRVGVQVVVSHCCIRKKREKEREEQRWNAQRQKKTERNDARARTRLYACSLCLCVRCQYYTTNTLKQA